MIYLNLGFERLLQSGISPLDPQWIELQRRFANGGGGPMSHMPGVYPPASITNDLIQRERERMERMGTFFFLLFSLIFILQL